MRIDLSDLQEGIVVEITVDKKKMFLTCFYRSLSKNDDEFQIFFPI